MAISRVLTFVTLSLLSVMAGALDHVEIILAKAAGSDADKRRLSVYGSRPSNLQCDLVSFDDDQVLELAQRLDAGETSVEHSSVAISIGGEKPVTYKGHSFDVDLDVDSKLIKWEGWQSGDESFRAYLTIPQTDIVYVYIFSEKGRFLLEPSPSNENYILCQLDPDYRAMDFD